MLKDFIEQSYASPPFSNMADVTDYYRSFSQIAVPLIKKAKIPTTERDFYFVAGLPKDAKDWFLTQVADAKRKRSAPPNAPETIAILKKHFDEDLLAFQPWTEETKASAVPPLITSAQLPSVPNVAATPQIPSTTVDDLARQLERLTLVLNAQSSNTGGSNNNPNQSTPQGQAPPSEERNFSVPEIVTASSFPASATKDVSRPQWDDFPLRPRPSDQSRISSSWSDNHGQTGRSALHLVLGVAEAVGCAGILAATTNGRLPLQCFTIETSSNYVTKEDINVMLAEFQKIEPIISAVTDSIGTKTKILPYKKSP
ncbi:hypothetical protein B0H13DRAFT_1923459 [Mycena leptocephala]|nr:hypothetical protein B0H13DRAFT_1923459 [Mycena leptocephala]